MLKLYRFSLEAKEYWETWEIDGGAHVVHWGALGTRGESKTLKPGLLKGVKKLIQREIDEMIAAGFAPVPMEEHATLLIEYVVEGWGSEGDLAKRHRLENRMNETLGWTGLGACDGGSIGSGTMEVCNFVVDFELAKRVIKDDLKGTEFENYSRIYNESE